MKLLVTATTSEINAPVDPRFGRCAFFILVETDSLEWKAFPNPGSNEPGGAGIKAAQFAADHEAEVVLSGEFGPNAFNALKAANIRMFHVDNAFSVLDAINQFKKEQLTPVAEPKKRDRMAR
jgi:predicted Fe-Mo cluster-binding NifX family protein